MFSDSRNLQVMTQVIRVNKLQQSAQAGTGYATPTSDIWEQTLSEVNTAIFPSRSYCFWLPAYSDSQHDGT